MNYVYDFRNLGGIIW